MRNLGNARNEKPEAIQFVEFMEICADSEIISASTARKICLFAKYQGGVGALPSVQESYQDYSERFRNLLRVKYDERRSFDNYIVSEENFHSVELARTVALIPRIWKNLSPVLFYGKTGQGKTHLLSAMATVSRQRTLFLNTNDLMMEYRYCVDLHKELDLLNWIVSHNFLLLDDIQFAEGNLEFQNFLCSVFNRLSSDKNAVVLCSNLEPKATRDYHVTFYSRITSGITIELKMLDFDARVALLKQKFSHTGFSPGDEIIYYIASEISTNVRTLKAVARAVIACLLDTPARESIDLKRVKKLIEALHLYNVSEIAGDKDVPSSIPPVPEQSPSTSADSTGNQFEQDPSDNVKASPFIVVEIENEDVKETASNDSHPAEVDHALVDTDNSTDRVDDSGEYRTLLETANTVDKQIDALLMAAGKRIEQLLAKNADPAEVNKLQNAVKHLKNKNLEAAMIALK